MPNSDLNLLFGILALQLNFISRDALIAAMGEWVLSKERSLGEILQAAEHLNPERRQLLDALVNEHLRQHAGDAQQSLAALSSVASVRDVLQQVNDPELQASMAHLPADGRVRHDAETVVPSQPFGLPVGGTQEPTSAAVGTRFRILRPHARGGLGQVSVALDEELHREVALKEIQSQHADNTDSRSRFVLEAEITGRLEHPGIVPVYGLGHYADGRPFYAMRFIQGDSLKAAIEVYHRPLAKVQEHDQQRPANIDLAERNVQFRQLLRRFVDVCNTMAYAHSRGILHRDLKPGNIMVGKYGETLVVDWGLAKSLGHGDRTESPEVKESTLLPTSGNSSETLPGLAIGTPGYMSPEQASGKLEELGPTSDVYSLGATLYHILTGQAPFEGRNVTEILQKIQRGEFPKPSQIKPETPRALEAISLQAMALQPKDRYTSPKVLADDIEHWLADEPVRAHQEGLVARGTRWLRKHRAWAMSGASALALVAIVSSVAAFWINGQKEVIAEKERAATKLGKEKSALATKEKAAREKADLNADSAKRHLYVANMNLAQSAWENASVGETLRLLELYRPVAAQTSGKNDLRGFEWFFWDHWCHSERLTLYGHNAPVSGVVFSPDGKWIASASWDQSIKVWNATTGQASLTLKGHTSAVTSVAFSPDGKRLASASHDNMIRVWNALTGQVLMMLKGHTFPVTCVAFSPDGKWLASASYDQTIKTWDAATGEVLHTLNGHTAEVYGVVFNPDGSLLASASFDHTIRVWDPATGNELHVLTGHQAGCTNVAFSSDGKLLASASQDETVKVWNAATCQEHLTLEGHTQEVTSVVFSPDGKRLSSGSSDNTLKVWDLAMGHEIFTLRGHSGALTCVMFSPDGKRLASASYDATVKFWDATTGQRFLTLKGHNGWTTSVVFSPDEMRLASASSDGTVKVWDATLGLEVLTLKGHTREVTSVVFSPDGKRLASASSDTMVKLWDATTGHELLMLKGHTGEVTSVVFSPDGKRLASASSDATVKVWDAATGDEFLKMESHTGSVTSVVFSPDGKRLASASSDATVKVWDATLGQEYLTLKGHTSVVKSVVFSPDGMRLASAGSDMTVKLWDATSGQEFVTLKGHTGEVTSVVFSPDGKRLASAGSDATLKLWDAATGQETLALKDGHTYRVNSVVFSKDGMRLASAGSDNTVKVWDARPWTPKMRGESESVTLVRNLFANPVILKKQVLATIRSDATITEETRTKAADMAKQIHLYEIDEVPAWCYSTNGNGVFVKTRDGWVERCDNGAQYYFSEIRKADDVVELFDHLRNLSVRLFKDHSEISANKKDWSFLYIGEWR